MVTDRSGIWLWALGCRLWAPQDHARPGGTPPTIGEADRFHEHRQRRVPLLDRHWRRDRPSDQTTSPPESIIRRRLYPSDAATYERRGEARGTS